MREQSDTYPNTKYACNYCGKIYYQTDDGKSSGKTHCTYRTSLRCDLDEDTPTYEIGCGKTEQTIESATII